MSRLTTPFGRRPVALGHIAAQMQARMTREEAGKPGSNTPAAVHKWHLFRTLTEARRMIGVSDRALGVLNALLSFHQETALALPPADAADDGEAPCDLVVFPSNRALCQRAHGMAEQTLRRHIAALVDAGLIIRRDSPNGKRYARKAVGGDGERAQAFGFDLTPLVSRAAEFETLADEVRREARALAARRERISLFRRDLAKLIALGLDEGLPGAWAAFRLRFLALAAPLRRLQHPEGLAALEADLAHLRRDVFKALEVSVVSKEMSGNAADSGRLQSNSNTITSFEFEPASNQAGGEVQPSSADEPPASVVCETKSEPDLPLGLVMEACPDIVEYGPDGQLRSWGAFLAAAQLVRPMLGISPDAWREAVEGLGERSAAIAVAGILQRSEHSSEAVTAQSAGGAVVVTVNGSPAIRSPGGYLRALTEKARTGDFATGPLLMALIGQRLKARRVGRPDRGNGAGG
jgi:replication initiation protein RepC